jgi:DNA-directed RNA polymerase subunit RPC12/RpoP
MKDLFDDIDFDVECPNCGKKLSFKAKNIGKTVKCKYCSSSILLKDNGSIAKEIKKANKSFNDLEKTLKNFGK